MSAPHEHAYKMGANGTEIVCACGDRQRISGAPQPIPTSSMDEAFSAATGVQAQMRRGSERPAEASEGPSMATEPDDGPVDVQSLIQAPQQPPDDEPLSESNHHSTPTELMTEAEQAYDAYLNAMSEGNFPQAAGAASDLIELFAMISRHATAGALPDQWEAARHA